MYRGVAKCSEEEFALRASVTKMGLLGEVGEYGLNHIPAKNAACESGPEGSNPSLSANNTERSALGVAMSKESCAVLD